MDVLRTLRAILAPDSTPAIRSRPPIPAKEVPAGSRTFAQTLREAALGEDPSIAAFGVQLPRQGTIVPTAEPRPIVVPEAPEDFLGPFGGVVPPGRPVADLPIDTLHIETRDTLKSLILDPRESSGPTIMPPAAGSTGPSLRGSPMPDQAGLLSPDMASVARYEALAGGHTAGANFERFEDAVARGFFTDDQAGYARYLQYNSSGAAPRMDRPDFCGWIQAADLVYAIKSGAHQDNNQSPVWTAAAAYPYGRDEILRLAASAQWSPEQRQDALTEYSETFQRLYSEWASNGPPLPALNG